MFLPLLKEERPALDQVHSQVLQNVVDRLDKAFRHFFEDAKQEKSLDFLDFEACIDTIAFVIRKADFLLLAKS